MENSKMTLKRFNTRALSWFKISRLYFYPLPLIVYSLGAAVVYNMYRKFNLGIFVLGYIFIFLVELCSVLTNEYFDFKTDLQNKNSGPFNGGSRVLVEGRLELREVRAAIIILILLIFGTGYILLKLSSEARPLLMISLLFIGLFLGLGYTCPPFKLSYRGIGEIVVAFTFSPYLIFCGYTFQGGAWKEAFPWLISLPLLFSVFSAITLSGVPDIQADRAVQKRTLAVIFGQRMAIRLSIVSILAAALAWIALFYFKILRGWPGLSIFFVLIHALFLLTVLLKLVRSDHLDRKINKEMILALSYMIWFAIIPFLSMVA
jgi:1,4-dihydroxy-2-naphthoate octaprenyltransferase